MRFFDSWLRDFYHKHPKLGIPHLMNYIVIGTIAAYLFNIMTRGYFCRLMTFRASYIISYGQLWRLFTFIFLPLIDNLLFLAISLYFYWLAGSKLERKWGITRFTLFYLTGVLLNIILGFLTGTPTMNYVNLSMFLAVATLNPNTRFRLFFHFPVKAKWLAGIAAVLFVLAILRYLIGGYFLLALIPIVAILNYILFFASNICDLIRRIKRRAES